MIYFITKEQLPEIENLDIVIKRLENGLTSVSIFPFDITEEMVQADEIFGISKKLITDLIDRLSFKDNQLARCCNQVECFLDSWGGLDNEYLENVIYEPDHYVPTKYYTPKRKGKMRWFEGETLYNQRCQVEQEITDARVTRKQRESTLVYLPETISDRHVYGGVELETILTEDESLPIIELKSTIDIANLIDLVHPHLEEDRQKYSWTLVGRNSFCGQINMVKIGSAIIGTICLRRVEDLVPSIRNPKPEFDELGFYQQLFVCDPDSTLKIERDKSARTSSYTEFKEYGLYSEEGYVGVPSAFFQKRV